MRTIPPTLNERFAGTLLGLAVGDALGAPFEGQSPETIAGGIVRPKTSSAILRRGSCGTRTIPKWRSAWRRR
jgi:ADP-ribosylglycohydrolase